MSRCEIEILLEITGWGRIVRRTVKFVSQQLLSNGMKGGVSNYLKAASMFLLQICALGIDDATKRR